jgi:hypothetical protein
MQKYTINCNPTVKLFILAKTLFEALRKISTDMIEGKIRIFDIVVC